MIDTPRRPSLESVTTINRDGSHRVVHTASVSGRFTRLRLVFALALTALYVALPWIPINGQPALFFDLAQRQFHYFGLTFVGQDIWLAFFVLSGLGFCLFYTTALLGRVWCGWACPQTVFLDFARRIERWCEGDSITRRQSARKAGSLSQAVRRVAKHFLYALLALLLAHVLLSYFVSIPRLYRMMTHAPGDNWSSFAFVFLIAGALWFDLAWFREQFCIVLCPYGRLQSALIDNDSLVVGYDTTRGEPRGRKGTEGAGDCVDCLRCVQVCPTGIDIRQGLQMECIGCAACIDACDAVMTKLDRPKGLVRYDSRHGFEGKRTHWLRPRILLYTGLALLGAAVLTVATSTLKAASVGLTRMTGIPYTIEGGVVRNQFLVRVLNKRNVPVKYRVEVLDMPSDLHWQGADGGIAVAALGEELRMLVLTLPRTSQKGEMPLRIRLVGDDGTSIEKSATFLGPLMP